MTDAAADALPVVYQFDSNLRVYERGHDGRAVGGPIYREHFRKFYIVGTEKRSWLLSAYPDGRFPRKASKAGYLTAEEVEDQCWRESHRYKLSKLLEYCQDTAKLKAIAEILDYTPEHPTT